VSALREQLLQLPAVRTLAVARHPLRHSLRWAATADVSSRPGIWAAGRSRVWNAGLWNASRCTALRGMSINKFKLFSSTCGNPPDCKLENCTGCTFTCRLWAATADVSSRPGIWAAGRSRVWNAGLWNASRCVFIHLRKSTGLQVRKLYRLHIYIAPWRYGSVMMRPYGTPHHYGAVPPGRNVNVQPVQFSNLQSGGFPHLVRAPEYL
jgi:hypothetical protein